jgi:hypothetical protein
LPKFCLVPSSSMPVVGCTIMSRWQYFPSVPRADEIDDDCWGEGGWRCR